VSESTFQSRRALLIGAAGGAAAVAASAALPVSRALAVDQPLLVNVPNAATAATTLDAALAAAATLGVNNTGAGGQGLAGTSVLSGNGVRGTSGDASGAPSDTSLTGVFGYAEGGNGSTTFGTGVWGVSDDVGVYGSGSTGVVGDGGSLGTGVEGYSVSGYGLYVTGKVKLANRSGRLAVGAGKSSIAKTVTGMTASNIVIAVLQTSETGTWVRAAVAGAGKFTVYFNKTLPTSSVVGWLVLN
jgi:hypothetical protein